MIKRIDGKALSQTKKQLLKEKTERLIEESHITPGLAVILVGDDPASNIYVRNKEKACQEVGFYSEKKVFSADISEAELLQEIDSLNRRDDIDGILVQLPLPPHINKDVIIESIDISKDVDGFSPENLGKLLLNQPSLQPCTPKGCIELLEHAGCDIDGKKAVVIGRSHIVGKPVAQMLLNKNATVTICHSHTKDLETELKDADIIVVAIGKANFLKPHSVKEGAYIIDVGINRDENGKLHGDVDQSAFEASDNSYYLTPVPGGVGPMTITMLLENTFLAAQRRNKKGD